MFRCFLTSVGWGMRGAHRVRRRRAPVSFHISIQVTHTPLKDSAVVILVEPAPHTTAAHPAACLRAGVAQVTSSPSTCLHTCATGFLIL
jgi:hypothetical protein